MTASVRTHPPTPCQPCKWCGSCACDRWDQQCHEHQFLDGWVREATRSRERYEAKRCHPEYAFAEFGSPDQPGKIHALDCHIVRTGIQATEHFLSDPTSWGDGHPLGYPNLLTREEAQAPGRKRCAVCAPDIREVTRPPKQRRSKLGWPERDGKCA